jgi:hypothetical protein
LHKQHGKGLKPKTLVNRLDSHPSWTTFHWRSFDLIVCY